MKKKTNEMRWRYFKCFILVVVFLILVLKKITEKNTAVEDKELKIKYQKAHLFTEDEIFQNPISIAQFPTTVASIYIELNKSKHSTGEYDSWVGDMSKSVSAAPLALITDYKSYLKISKMRMNYTTKYYIIHDIWTVLRELGSERNKSYLNNYLNYQNSVDPEAHIHVPELYAIWNLKIYFLEKISNENPFNSNFFIYTDAGAFRSGSFLHWPDQNIIEDFLMPILGDRMLLGNVAESIDSNSFKPENDHIQGTFMAGNRNAIEMFHKNFYDLHDQRFDENLFIGKDQTLMNLIAFKLHNQTVFQLKAWLAQLKCSYLDHWFFYLNFFAQNDQCSKNKTEFLSVYLRI
jgi:hypothetical protein